MELITETGQGLLVSNLLHISHIWKMSSEEITRWPDTCQWRGELTATSNPHYRGSNSPATQAGETQSHHAVCVRQP